ncbi:MAG: hypothetical protein Athens101410_706 [Parcubacteria group bacterium Athens1014_10]|nr:MAG: hypothetical protein Athens101410_706 [Parcubacteria group bacterium Athens1014_10]TSD04691.1 MAG: hypothetical protein Athens071412_686 [Parcubacteria group bacterium Athens0714_12]
MDLKTAENLLKKVKQDYEITAQEFSDTRARPWEEFKIFLNYIKNEDKILDLGCGNGRLYKFFENQKIDYLGADDNCQGLINLAKKKNPQVKFVVADVLNLPFQNQEFNTIFSIAMLHQIPSDELRLKALKEMKRILKNNGILVITSWNLWQPKLILKYKLWHLLFGFKKNNLDKGDVFIPWKLKNSPIIQRYYHAFTLKEMSRLVKKAGFKIIKKYKNYNLAIIAKNANI